MTPQQAQKIALAADVGHLSLILRKSGDANVVMNERVTAADLSEGAERSKSGTGTKNRARSGGVATGCNSVDHPRPQVAGL